MTRDTIAQRLTELDALRQQQQQRLRAAQSEVEFARTSLERIEGAAQDCQWWQARLDEVQAEEAVAAKAAAERAGLNGEAPAGRLLPATDG